MRLEKRASVAAKSGDQGDAQSPPRDGRVHRPRGREPGHRGRGGFDPQVSTTSLGVDAQAGNSTIDWLEYMAAARQDTERRAAFDIGAFEFTPVVSATGGGTAAGGGASTAGGTVQL